jgi:hypothetical protein
MIVQQSAANVIKVKIAIFTFMDQYGGFANTPNIAMTNSLNLESPSAASKLTTFTADNAPKFARAL